jgi:putative transposase
MPRVARLDAVGILQHVIVRGIEKRYIFLDDGDRRYFLKRFSELLQETETDCLAWALMPNHAHLLVRPRRNKLAMFMRRLLTSYAVYFNLRHSRSGHLFQNRYKSIACEEDPYLLELVRYIHLNPLRAGLVKGMRELDHYKWSGHAVLIGNQTLPGQEIHEALAHFGENLSISRRRYRKFVMDGISLGRRDELVGGGLRRSREVVGPDQTQTHDQRVLGSGAFVTWLRNDNELIDRLPAVKSLAEVIEHVVRIFGIRPDDLNKRNRSKLFADARGAICYLAVTEMGLNGAEAARSLNITRAGVSIAAKRGQVLVQNDPSLRSILENQSTT